MDTLTNLYEDIARRTAGDIYIGVVGPARTGKSTFIQRFMEALVLPNIPEGERGCPLIYKSYEWPHLIHRISLPLLIQAHSRLLCIVVLGNGKFRFQQLLPESIWAVN